VDPLWTLRKNLQASGPLRRGWTGAWCAAQGVLVTLRSPALLRLALVPVIINLALYPLMGWGAWRALGFMFPRVWPWETPDGIWAVPFTAVEWVVWLLLALTLGLVALLLVGAVGAAAASPFLDVVSQRTEALITRHTVPTGPGLVEGVLRTARMQLGLLALYVPCLVITTLVSLFPGVGLFVGPPAQAGITVLFLCLQMTDWAAERRRLDTRARVRLILDHKAACLGFGAACWMMMLFPFTLPFGAAGGTMLLVGLLPDGFDSSLPAPVPPQATP